MDYYQTHDEIDEIGEGLIRKYQYQSFIQGTPTGAVTLAEGSASIDCTAQRTYHC